MTITNDKASASAEAEGSSSSSSSLQSSSSDTVLSRWLHHLNRIDEIISTPVFRYGLPKWIELVFSVPATFFGMTFSVVVGPLWIAVLALMARDVESQQEHESNNFARILLLQAITLTATAIYVVAWGGYQVLGWKKPVLELFWKRELFLLSSPWNAAVLAYTVLGLRNDQDQLSVLSNKAIFSMALYPLTMYPLMLLVLEHLKTTTGRSRPAKKDFELHDKAWTNQKSFASMTHLLATHDGHKSFPSGDVASAALLAIPLFGIDIGGSGSGSGDYNYNYCKGVAIAIVVLSALGRMYVLAHHFSDVVAGACLSYGIHRIATALGCTMHNTEWWHPFLAFGGYGAITVWKSRSSGSASGVAVAAAANTAAANAAAAAAAANSKND